MIKSAYKNIFGELPIDGSAKINTEVVCDGTVRFSVCDNDKTGGVNLVISEGPQQVPGTPDKSGTKVEPVITLEFTKVGSVNALVKVATALQERWNRRVLDGFVPGTAFYKGDKPDSETPTAHTPGHPEGPLFRYPGCDCEDCKKARAAATQTIDKPKWVDGEGCQCGVCTIRRRQHRQEQKSFNREKFLNDWNKSRPQQPSDQERLAETSEKVNSFGEYVVKCVRKVNSWEAATKGYMWDAQTPASGVSRGRYFIALPDRIAGLNYSYRFTPKYSSLVYRATNPASGQEIQLPFNTIVPARRVVEHGDSRFAHRRDRYEALATYVQALGFPKPEFDENL